MLFSTFVHTYVHTFRYVLSRMSMYRNLELSLKKPYKSTLFTYKTSTISDLLCGRGLFIIDFLDFKYIDLLFPEQKSISNIYPRNLLTNLLQRVTIHQPNRTDPSRNRPHNLTTTVLQKVIRSLDA